MIEPDLLTKLRPPHDDEVALLAAWHDDPQSPYEDWGTGARVAAPVGGGELVIADSHDDPLGTVSWHPVLYGPHRASQAFDIGISVRPFARGLGHGVRAQRMLAKYLFATTDVHRVQASTDVTNTAEQRALEKAGFTREGVLRGAQWRQGAWHDLVSYACLRHDAPERPPA